MENGESCRGGGRVSIFLESFLERQNVALSIKDPEADRLARELAEATGESLTEAVTKALRERLRLVRGDNRSEDEFLADIRKIVDDFQRHRIVDSPNEDEILGYDEFGLPTR